MDSQAIRIRRAKITGTIVAFCLPILVLCPLWLTTQDAQALTVGFALGVPAALSTFLAIHFIWRRAILKRETRKRGFWFGALTGFAAFIGTFIIVIFIFSAGVAL